MINTNQNTNHFTNMSEIHCLLNQNYIDEGEWIKITQYYDTLNNGMIKKMKSKYGNISKTDVRLFILIQLGYSTKGISNVKKITVAGVKKGRQRLLRKMNLPRFSAFNHMILTEA